LIPLQSSATAARRGRQEAAKAIEGRREGEEGEERVTTGGTIAKALTLHFALEREKMKEEMDPKRKRKRRKRRRRKMKRRCGGRNGLNWLVLRQSSRMGRSAPLLLEKLV